MAEKQLTLAKLTIQSPNHENAVSIANDLLAVKPTPSDIEELKQENEQMKSAYLNIRKTMQSELLKKDQEIAILKRQLKRMIENIRNFTSGLVLEAKETVLDKDDESSNDTENGIETNEGVFKNISQGKGNEINSIHIDPLGLNQQTEVIHADIDSTDHQIPHVSTAYESAMEVCNTSTKVTEILNVPVNVNHKIEGEETTDIVSVAVLATSSEVESKQNDTYVEYNEENATSSDSVKYSSNLADSNIVSAKDSINDADSNMVSVEVPVDVDSNIVCVEDSVNHVDRNIVCVKDSIDHVDCKIVADQQSHGVEQTSTVILPCDNTNRSTNNIEETTVVDGDENKDDNRLNSLSNESNVPLSGEISGPEELNASSVDPKSVKLNINEEPINVSATPEIESVQCEDSRVLHNAMNCITPSSVQKQESKHTRKPSQEECKIKAILKDEFNRISDFTKHSLSEKNEKRRKSSSEDNSKYRLSDRLRLRDKDKKDKPIKTDCQHSNTVNKVKSDLSTKPQNSNTINKVKRDLSTKLMSEISNSKVSKHSRRRSSCSSSSTNTDSSFNRSHMELTLPGASPTKSVDEQEMNPETKRKQKTKSESPSKSVDEQELNNDTKRKQKTKIESTKDIKGDIAKMLFQGDDSINMCENIASEVDNSSILKGEDAKTTSKSIKGKQSKASENLRRKSSTSSDGGEQKKIVNKHSKKKSRSEKEEKRGGSNKRRNFDHEAHKKEIKELAKKLAQSQPTIVSKYGSPEKLLSPGKRKMSEAGKIASSNVLKGVSSSKKMSEAEKIASSNVLKEVSSSKKMSEAEKIASSNVLKEVSSSKKMSEAEIIASSNVLKEISSKHHERGDLKMISSMKSESKLGNINRDNCNKQEQTNNVATLIEESIDLNDESNKETTVFEMMEIEKEITPHLKHELSTKSELSNTYTDRNKSCKEEQTINNEATVNTDVKSTDFNNENKNEIIESETMEVESETNVEVLETQSLESYPVVTEQQEHSAKALIETVPCKIQVQKQVFNDEKSQDYSRLEENNVKVNISKTSEENVGSEIESTVEKKQGIEIGEINYKEFSVGESSININSSSALSETLPLSNIQKRLQLKAAAAQDEKNNKKQMFAGDNIVSDSNLVPSSFGKRKRQMVSSEEDSDGVNEALIMSAIKKARAEVDDNKNEVGSSNSTHKKVSIPMEEECNKQLSLDATSTVEIQNTENNSSNINKALYTDKKDKKYTQVDIRKPFEAAAAAAAAAARSGYKIVNFKATTVQDQQLSLIDKTSKYSNIHYNRVRRGTYRQPVSGQKENELVKGYLSVAKDKIRDCHVRRGEGRMRDKKMLKSRTDGTYMNKIEKAMEISAKLGTLPKCGAIFDKIGEDVRDAEINSASSSQEESCPGTLPKCGAIFDKIGEDVRDAEINSASSSQEESCPEFINSNKFKDEVKTDDADENPSSYKDTENKKKSKNTLKFDASVIDTGLSSFISAMSGGATSKVVKTPIRWDSTSLPVSNKPDLDNSKPPDNKLSLQQSENLEISIKAKISSQKSCVDNSLVDVNKPGIVGQDPFSQSAVPNSTSLKTVIGFQKKGSIYSDTEYKRQSKLSLSQYKERSKVLNTKDTNKKTTDDDGGGLKKHNLSTKGQENNMDAKAKQSTGSSADDVLNLVGLSKPPATGKISTCYNKMELIMKAQDNVGNLLTELNVPSFAIDRVREDPLKKAAMLENNMTNLLDSLVNVQNMFLTKSSVPSPLKKKPQTTLSQNIASDNKIPTRNLLSSFKIPKKIKTIEKTEENSSQNSDSYVKKSSNQIPRDPRKRPTDSAASKVFVDPNNIPSLIRDNKCQTQSINIKSSSSCPNTSKLDSNPEKMGQVLSFLENVISRSTKVKAQPVPVIPPPQALNMPPISYMMSRPQHDQLPNNNITSSSEEIQNEPEMPPVLQKIMADYESFVNGIMPDDENGNPEQIKQEYYETMEFLSGMRNRNPHDDNLHLGMSALHEMMVVRLAAAMQNAVYVSPDRGAGSVASKDVIQDEEEKSANPKQDYENKNSVSKPMPHKEAKPVHKTLYESKSSSSISLPPTPTVDCEMNETQDNILWNMALDDEQMMISPSASKSTVRKQGQNDGNTSLGVLDESRDSDISMYGDIIVPQISMSNVVGDSIQLSPISHINNEIGKSVTPSFKTANRSVSPADDDGISSDEDRLNIDLEKSRETSFDVSMGSNKNRQVEKCQSLNLDSLSSSKTGVCEKPMEDTASGEPDLSRERIGSKHTESHSCRTNIKNSVESKGSSKSHKSPSDNHRKGLNKGDESKKASKHNKNTTHTERSEKLKDHNSNKSGKDSEKGITKVKDGKNTADLKTEKSMKYKSKTSHISKHKTTKVCKIDEQKTQSNAADRYKLVGGEKNCIANYEMLTSKKGKGNKTVDSTAASKSSPEQLKVKSFLVEKERSSNDLVGGKEENKSDNNVVEQEASKNTETYDSGGSRIKNRAKSNSTNSKEGKTVSVAQSGNSKDNSSREKSYKGDTSQVSPQIENDNVIEASCVPGGNKDSISEYSPQKTNVSADVKVKNIGNKENITDLANTADIGNKENTTDLANTADIGNKENITDLANSADIGNKENITDLANSADIGNKENTTDMPNTAEIENVFKPIEEQVKEKSNFSSLFGNHSVNISNIDENLNREKNARLKTPENIVQPVSSVLEHDLYLSDMSCSVSVSYQSMFLQNKSAYSSNREDVQEQNASVVADAQKPQIQESLKTNEDSDSNVMTSTPVETVNEELKLQIQESLQSRKPPVLDLNIGCADDEHAADLVEEFDKEAETNKASFKSADKLEEVNCTNNDANVIKGNLRGDLELSDSDSSSHNFKQEVQQNLKEKVYQSKSNISSPSHSKGSKEASSSEKQKVEKSIKPEPGHSSLRMGDDVSNNRNRVINTNAIPDLDGAPTTDYHAVEPPRTEDNSVAMFSPLKNFKALLTPQKLLSAMYSPSSKGSSAFDDSVTDSGEEDGGDLSKLKPNRKILTKRVLSLEEQESTDSKIEARKKDNENVVHSKNSRGYDKHIASASGTKLKGRKKRKDLLNKSNTQKDKILQVSSTFHKQYEEGKDEKQSYDESCSDNRNFSVSIPAPNDIDICSHDAISLLPGDESFDGRIEKNKETKEEEQMKNKQEKKTKKKAKDSKQATGNKEVQKDKHYASTLKYHRTEVSIASKSVPITDVSEISMLTREDSFGDDKPVGVYEINERPFSAISRESSSNSSSKTNKTSDENQSYVSNISDKCESDAEDNLKENDRERLENIEPNSSSNSVGSRSSMQDKGIAILRSEISGDEHDDDRSEGHRSCSEEIKQDDEDDDADGEDDDGDDVEADADDEAVADVGGEDDEGSAEEGEITDDEDNDNYKDNDNDDNDEDNGQNHTYTVVGAKLLGSERVEDSQEESGAEIRNSEYSKGLDLRRKLNSRKEQNKDVVIAKRATKGRLAERAHSAESSGRSDRDSERRPRSREFESKETVDYKRDRKSNSRSKDHVKIRNRGSRSPRRDAHRRSRSGERMAVQKRNRSRSLNREYRSRRSHSRDRVRVKETDKSQRSRSRERQTRYRRSGSPQRRGGGERIRLRSPARKDSRSDRRHSPFRRDRDRSNRNERVNYGEENRVSKHESQRKRSCSRDRKDEMTNRGVHIPKPIGKEQRGSRHSRSDIDSRHSKDRSDSCETNKSSSHNRQDGMMSSDSSDSDNERYSKVTTEKSTPKNDSPKITRRGRRSPMYSSRDRTLTVDGRERNETGDYSRKSKTVGSSAKCKLGLDDNKHNLSSRKVEGGSTKPLANNGDHATSLNLTEGENSDKGKKRKRSNSKNTKRKKKN